MAKYGFSTAIPYGTDLFEFTGVEYCEWEDALERAEDSDAGREWATYDFLFEKGYFVQEPKIPRPQPAAPRPKQEKKNGDNGGVVSPGIRDVPNLITGDAREPVWTQSRILLERDKLLKEREKILTIKEKALAQKVLEQQILERVRGENTKSTSEVFYTVAGAFIIISILIFAVILYSS